MNEQISLRMPRKTIEKIDRAAHAAGLSRNDFLNNLYSRWEDFSKAAPEERVFLHHLVVWGPQNFRSGRPDIRMFAQVAGWTEDGARQLVDSFLAKGWLEKRSAVVGKRYNFDIAIDGNIYGITAEGLRVAGF